MNKYHKSALSQEEERILSFWQKNDIFTRSVAQREGQDRFVFYDGPPFANGLPHLGHILTSSLKDAVTRYQTMRGKYVPRRFGWDCHGLPPELLAEKELGISGKKAIAEYGIEKFVGYCRDSVLRFTGEWHEYVSRLGRWVDFSDDYRTMDQDYMESVLWAFSELYKKGLIYEGERVVPYSYGAQTAVSNFETRQDDSYRDRDDLTATVRFSLVDGRNLLGWTTTPWTLPANMLLAVNQSITYVEMRKDDDVVILAEAALERYQEELAGYQRGKKFVGADLVGLTYAPLFPYFEGQDRAFRVVSAEFVETGEGTGVVHVAPGHGEDDYWLGKKEQVLIASPVDDDGRFTDEVKDYVGRLVFDANGEIVADLEKSKKLFSKAMITHKYPHCWRTDVPIIYRAMSAWFVDVPKIKDKLLSANQKIEWHPEHVKEGAFGKWLENAREWNISRKRYWGAPIPVWKTEDGEVVIIGSIEELRRRAVNPDLVQDLHRPTVDAIEIKTDSGKIARRIEDVFDCWFESGSMPFAQVHYPFENKELFESGHPADFITEYVGQTRGWFYTLHVMSVALFDKPAFKQALAHGILLGSDGRKLSKRLGNYPENTETFDQFGSDAMRFYLFSTPLVSGETAVFNQKSLLEAQRNVIQRFKNVQTFYSMYAKVDNFKSNNSLTRPSVSHTLDRWVLARLSATIKEVTNLADALDVQALTRSLTIFLDDLSNWYVRRSRRRFWKSGDDSDKMEAYQTLYCVLLQTAKLFAPWAPFIAEDVWQEVSDGKLEQSVHLAEWPTPEYTDQDIIRHMAIVREAVTAGLAQRASAGIKVRQPLQSVTVTVSTKLSTQLEEIIAEELNVKQVKILAGDVLEVEINTDITENLRQEGIVRDIIRLIQVARKNAGLEIDDRIHLALEADDTMNLAITSFRDMILTEVLGVDLASSVKGADYISEGKLVGENIKIGITKQG
ncbi:isoleucine--tRNA ligase [bacterium]|nr:MAG: isoleucine--tRNA ligase [bacterium]